MQWSVLIISEVQTCSLKKFFLKLGSEISLFSKSRERWVHKTGMLDTILWCDIYVKFKLYSYPWSPSFYEYLIPVGCVGLFIRLVLIRSAHNGTWRYHDMKSFSALLALCEGNPPVTGGCLSQGASNTQLWYSISTQGLVYKTDVLDIIFTRGQFWPSGIVIAPVRPSVTKFVHAITHHPFKLGPPNLDQRCKTPWLRSLLFWGGNQPWPSRSNSRSKSKFTPFWACPHHNLSPIKARIIKFGPEVQNTLVKIPIVLGGNWPWPSRSNLT